MPQSHYRHNILIEADIFGEQNVRRLLEDLSQQMDFRWTYERYTRTFRLSAKRGFSLDINRYDNGASMTLSSVIYGEEVETGW
ncbi:hypothetical protein V2G26_011109 [Clonostachys chloroleuca]